MKKNNYTNLYIISILLFLTGCGDNLKNFKDAVTGQKVKTTDEFLIKKKDPLILPPKYEELPLPGNKNANSESGSKSSVESILSKSKKAKTESKKTSDLEKQILETLRRRN